MNSSYQWIHDYCAREVSSALPNWSRLQVKALGEYGLLCFLIARNSENHALPDALRSERLTQSIALNLSKKVSGLPASQLALMLHLGLKIQVPHREMRESFETRESTISNEHAFSLGLVGKPLPCSSWAIASEVLLHGLAVDGVGVRAQYEITHLIFFATNFGERSPPWSDGISNVYEKLLYSLLEKGVSDDDCDLVGELLLSLIYLRRLPQGKQSFWRGVRYVEACRTSEGAYATNELRTHSEYAVFHATTVCCLLAHTLADISARGLSST